MVRGKRWAGIALGIILLSSMLAAGGRWLQAAAAAPARAPAMWGDPHVDLVVDSSASMGPELATLAQVWDDTDIVHLEQAVYGRFPYADSVNALPPLTDPAAVQAWLDSLEPAGGGACPDAALQALLAAARRSDPEATLGDTRALLLSDSAPQGDRTALARTANRLLQQRVRVYPVQSGWCWTESPLPMAAMKLLGQMTGGTAFPVIAGTGVTHTQMALNLLATADDLLLLRGMVSDGAPAAHSFNVDSSVGSITLQIDDDDDTPEDPDDDIWWECLTCTRRIRLPRCHTFNCLPLTATVRLPGGQIVGHGDPGVTFLHTGYGTQMKISSPNQAPLPAGTYQVRIAGNTAYQLRVAADAGIHMAYLGPHSVPAGDLLNVRVALLLPAVQGRQPAAQAPATLESAFIPLGGGPPLAGGLLYDDGQHQDGGAQDGIYGGTATLPPGAYRLVIRGQLADGSTVQRVAPAPIRARRFQMPSPGTRQVEAGTTVTHTFTLTNDSDGSQSFDLLAESSQGWVRSSTGANTVPPSVTLAAGEAIALAVPVHVPSGTPAGTVEETTLTAVGADLLASETATARTVVGGDFAVYLPLLQRE